MGSQRLIQSQYPSFIKLLNSCLSIYLLYLVILFFHIVTFSGCERLDPSREILISTDSVTTIGKSSCIVWGTILDPGAGGVEQYGICWAETENPTIDLNLTSLGNINISGSFSDTLNGLTDNTLYYCKAYAISGENVRYGEQVSFTTMQADLPVVVTYPVNNVRTTLAYSGGNVSDDGGAEVTLKGVCWNTSGNPEVQDDKTSDGSGLGSFESELTGLSPGTTYYVRAYATNSSGTGYGNEQDFTTAEYEAVPEAEFKVSERGARIGRAISFKDLSSNNPSSWLWHFGDGNSSTEQNPSYYYKSPGEYTITLTAVNELGADTEVKIDLIRILPTDSLTDFDGNKYYSIQIGDQWWMEENLRVTHYATGAPIAVISGFNEWNDLDHEDIACCYHGNDPANADDYGVLYTWAAAMKGALPAYGNPSNVPGVCPTGWHLPSDAEWMELEQSLGMSETDALQDSWRGTCEGSMIAGGIDKWNSASDSSIQFNDYFGLSGFHALPADLRKSWGEFGSLGWNAHFWTTSAADTYTAYKRHLEHSRTGIERCTESKDYGLSVRCVKD